MNEVMELGKNSTTGTFNLFIGKVLSTVILAVGTIILGIYILEDAYGLYTIALIPATTVLLFQNWGVSSAMTKYCAQYKATNMAGELRRIIITGLTFESATGIILMLLSLLTANFIASTIFGKPESTLLVALASTTVLSSGLLAASQSVFVGFERMGLNSLTMIFHAVIQGISMPLLVYLGYGATGAIIGYALSFIVTSGIAVGIVYFAIFKKLPPDNEAKSSISQTLKPLLSYGIPLSIATIVGGLSPQFYSFMMASLIDTATIGNYRIALNFAILLTFFTIPISTALFPVFSKIDARKEPQLLKTVFTSSVKYTALFLVPATMALIVLSEPLIGTIYGSKWASAPLFLALYVTSNLFAIFGNLSMGSLLSGLGETKMLMKLNLMTLFTGLPLAFLLIPQFGITGVIIVTIASGIPSILFGVYWIWKRYGVKADLRASMKIFLAATVAAAASYLLVGALNTVSWIQLASGTVFFLTIYLTASPLLGAVNQADINSLRVMFSSLTIVSKILKIPLSIVQKILDVRSKFSKKKLLPTTQNPSS